MTKPKDSLGNYLEDDDGDLSAARASQAAEVLNMINFHKKRVYGENLGAGPENARFILQFPGYATIIAAVEASFARHGFDDGI